MLSISLIFHQKSGSVCF